MTKLLSCLSVVLLSIAAASPCLAADSPWNGTWKQNLEKSKQTGGTVTITANGSGYHFSNGSTISYDFACDGKPYPVSGNMQLTCTAAPDQAFDIVMTAAGKVTQKQHRTFSADGKQMTMTTTNIAADGATTTTQAVRTRKSGATGMVGEWVDTKSVSSGSADEHTTTVTGDNIHIEFAHAKQTVDAKLDGSDGKITGPLVAAGTTVTYKSMGPNKLAYSQKLNGKVMVEGTMTLSADGKSYAFDSWLPGKQSEKAVQIFEKQ